MTFTISTKAMRFLGALAIAAGLMSLAACQGSGSDAQSNGQKLTQQAYGQQAAAVPYPVNQLADSLERKNLAERDVRYNNPSKISYVYLLNNQGGIVAYYTIKGKVSSTDSQMTTDNLIEGCKGGGSGACSVTVDAPGDDGSYGPEEPGVFFFTQDGVMVTWNGPYLETDAPMKINSTQTTLTYVTGSKPTSTGGYIK